MASKPQLTICTVSFYNADHIRLNWELTRQLNTGAESVHWIVAENTPGGAGSAATLWGDDRFTVIAGADSSHTPTYHHTIALNAALAKATTRFVLVLDPDFYIVRRGWVEAVSEYIENHSLGFLGVPWHPKYSSKYRYFPAVHCFFADTSKLSVAEMDFRPDYPDGPNDPNYPENYPSLSDYYALSPFAKLLTRLPFLRKRRRYHTDTGGRIHKNFAHGKRLKYECFTPVFRPKEDSTIRLSWKGRLLEAVLPDELCYLPKRTSSYRTTGFREQGLWVDAPRHWDEFYWHGEPFGFHVRRNFQKERRDPEAELRELRACLGEILLQSG